MLGAVIVIAMVLTVRLQFFDYFNVDVLRTSGFDFERFLDRRQEALRGSPPSVFEPEVLGFELVGRSEYFGCVEYLMVDFGLLKREFVFKDEDSGGFGVRDRVSGEVVIEARYEALFLNRGIVVGELDGKFYVYYKGTLAGISDEWVGIYSVYGFVRRGEYFFDVRAASEDEGFCFLRLLRVDGFRVVSPMDEVHGVVLVSRMTDSGDELMGFKCLEQGLLTEVKFISLGPIKNGAAMGLTRDRTYFLWVCELDGVKINMRTVVNGMHIFGFNNGYAIFRFNGRFGVINYDFEIVVQAVFDNLYLSVLGSGEYRFILCLATNIFFCFDLKPLSDSMCEIFILDKHYVTYSMGVFGLKDCKLNIISMRISEYDIISIFEFIFYIDGTLITLFNNYLWLFEAV